MEAYWSVERCGWVPCRGAHEIVATTWDAPDAASTPAPEVPQQRPTPEAAPAQA